MLMRTSDLSLGERSVSRAPWIKGWSRVEAIFGLCLLALIPVRAQSTFIIEAEDFNHGGGQHITAASQMPYLGGAYNGLGATANVDYFQPADDGSSPEYRIGETPNVPMTQNGDVDRGSWTMGTNYRIGWTDVGDWYNYTRNFPAGQYKVSVALSYGGVDANAMRGTLQRVTAGATSTSQTLQQLGSFNAAGSGAWGLNNLVPLRDGSGNQVVLNLSGVTTLRFTAESGDIDYFRFDPLLPPQLGQQPASLTVVEGQSASFTVANANSDPVSYQWQSNQVNIVGATNATFMLAYAPLNASGSRYRCVLSNSQGTATSSEATLTVTRDTNRPTIARVLNLSATIVQVTFSEPVAPGAATTTGNYALSGGVSISSAIMGSDTRTVLLTVSALTFGNSYTLTVNNVTDAAAIPNVILANSQQAFVAQPYAPLTVGSGTGDLTAANGGFNVTAAGGEIGGTADQMQFAYERRTNNFDVRVRVAKLSIPDAFVQAGLMAREDLQAGGRFAGVFSSSAQLGAFFESRGTASAASATAAPTGGYPANYPYMWLRLQRSANQFTGFASFDGETWTQLGSVSMTMPSVVYFGMAVASGSTNGSATAQFRQIEDVVGGTTAPLSYPRERIGPSSRRTGLAISEIMYHPKARTDLRDLEFIEIYNGGLIFEDMSGFRISGAIDYVFPAGTILPAGAFLVVAKVPVDVQTVYGISGIYGPYTNSLKNGSETIRLRDEMDHVLLEADYSDGANWPAAADGAGHSLVLARPSYGESDVRAWAASTYVGGSPGDVDPVTTAAEQNVVINEFLAHTDDPQVDFIELYNHSNSSVDISGFWLTDERDTNKFRIPAGTAIPARGFVSFDQNQMGFSLSSGGETIYLVNSNATRVVDAVKFGGQENGVSSGRWPDGAASVRRLSLSTPGGTNARWRSGTVVINEIMFSPISGEDDDEYVELYNTTSQAVSLAGWRFTDGPDFTFPAGASIPANGYVVVAKNAARLRSNYTQLTVANTFGDYDGSLRNSSEHIELAKPDQVISTNDLGQVQTNTIYIAVNDVRYRDGGRWPGFADGGGSSLELVDARSDNTQPDNWRESDETSKGQWSTVEFTGTLDNGNGSYPPNQLQITLQGAGECLVDQVEVLRSGVNYITQNANFEAGTTGWVFQGNHVGTTVDPVGAFEGTRCLHIRAPGRGDTGLNRIRTPLNTGLASGNTVTIRARVRWLKGWPEVLLRLRGSWLECAGAMSLPRNLGTPGQANSRAAGNAPPAIYEVAHSPILPAANQLVTVTARVSDPDPVSAVTLRYRVDPNATVTTVTMRDDGTAGDAVSGDGVYSGQITGRAAGTLVAFRVEAADSSGTRNFPSDAPTRECLVRWGESLPFGTIGSYRSLMTTAIANQWTAADGKDNTYRDMTFIYNADRVIYNATIKDKGSPFHGGGGDAFVVTPEDEPFLGTTDLALCSTGNAGNEETSQREQIAFWIGRKIGAHYLNRRFVNFFFNGSRFNGRNVMEDAEEPNGVYSSAAVPGAEDGDLYKIEDWFEFNDDASSFSNVDATLQRFTSGGTYKLARYRWAWRKRAVSDSANNYSNLFDLVTAVNTTGAGYVPQVENLVNVQNWMATFALQRIAGNWDSYGFNRGKNAYIYKGDGLRWEMFPWDIDFVLGAGSNPATDGLWGGGDPTINTMFNTPAFQRMLWQEYLEAVTGPMLPANYNPEMDGRYRALLANGIAGVNAPTGIRSYIDARRNHIISQMAGANTSSFALTINNGNNFSTNRSVISITGTAPFSIYGIEVNGIIYPVSWTSPRDWSISIPLAAVNNVLNFTAVDREGRPIAGVSDSITVTYTGVLYRPEDYIVINEIMYNSATPGGSFIEIFNRNATTSFNLSGYRLDGVGYTFPEGAILPANGYLLLVADRAAFAAAYGAAIIVFDQYSGNLDNGGERLQLVRPGATPAEDFIIDQVRYDDDLPWPLMADGFGPSLQLIDPAQDNWPVANWGVTATNAVNRATPGAANALGGTLAAFPKLYINEVLANNVSGAADRFGEREPWIELVNAGTTTIDLSGYYLSANVANLTQWQFPAGTTIAPGQFLVVWADNEPGESIATELHANFRLPAATAIVSLSRLQGSSPAIMDYVSYELLSAGRSYGSYPDAQPQNRRIFHFPTIGAANNPASITIDVVINEWMAGNTVTITDPADGDFDDWIELYNAGTTAVDLSGYTLTDVLTNSTKFTIPNGKQIPPGGYLLVWADEETGQNLSGPAVHASFKLGGAGEQIGLFAPDGAAVDTLTFGAQTDDVSEGRASDGAEPPFVTFTTPTPGAANFVNSANQSPVLTAIGNKSVAESALLTFQAIATDPDAGQSLTFSLSTDAPAGAAISPTSGVFTWTPSEAEGPGNYSFNVRVADNGVPSRSAFERITVTVSEVNRAPVLADIGNVTMNEGSPLSVGVEAFDPDLPANVLTYSLDPGAPTGASIDPSTGAISWVPAETQGTGDFTMTVRVRDNGTPALEHSRTFSVHVNEVNNAPVLQAILPQTIDEGQTLSITAQAADPDSPASAVTYSLEGTVPSGAAINPNTGLLTWPTSEATGPSTNIFNVRATENNAQSLSDSRSFSVVVREVNQPPTITPLSDITVVEGSPVSVRVSARDNDVPTQSLAYELLAGAPAGAAIAADGLFTWNVPVDFAAGTNSITVRVTDNGPGALSGTTTFRIIVQSQIRVAINEIMSAPASANAEYIELINASGATSWNISGWRLTGNGMNFILPAGTVLAPGGFLNIARNRTAFQTAYGTGAAVLGDWTGTFQPSGDTISLIRPGTGGASDEIVDRVTFSTAQPWPSAPGSALQLVDARQDNNRVANWEAAAGYSGPTNLITFTSNWRFNQSGTDLGTSWRGTAFPDAAWPQGNGLLYVEDAVLPEAKSTLLTIGPTTFYFRGRFTLPVKPQGAQLSLRTVIDDGAVFYLNGQEIYRVGIPAGAPSYATFADRTVGDATYEGPITLPSDLLVAGENVLAVEVHQVNATSTDVVFACALDLVGGQVPGFTPGAANSVTATLPPFDPVFVNEVLPVNTTGLSDSAGDRDPWVELYNSGTTPVELSGMYLTDAYATLTKWPFPSGATLNPGEYRVVWLDGEPGETIGTELHASFRLSASGAVALVRMQNAEPAVVDYINFSAAAANTSIGAIPNGQVDVRTTMSPTPGAPNSGAQANRPPTIAAISNQAIAEGAQLQFTISASDPDAGQTLSFAMQGAPVGASLSAAGVFTWTPTEAQAPLVQTVTVVVSDNGSPVLRATNTFQLSATEVNSAPTLPAIGDRSVDEGTLLSFATSATDSDLPAQSLSYVLQGAPAGAAISSSGVFTWTPTEAQGPGGYRISLVVSDSAAPAASVTNTFTVTVREANSAPSVGAVADRTVDEGSALAFTVTATDLDLPAQTLAFSLQTAPAGATISSSGAFSWTPTEAQGEASYPITVVVADNGTPAASGTISFTVTVREVNAAPAITAIADQTVSAGTPVALTVVTSDTDLPAQQLTFSLESGAPSGATIVAGTGAFSWTPTQAQAGTTNTITVRVTDNGSPAASATTSFRVIVSATPTVQPLITAGISQGRCSLSWSTQTGVRYRIQFKDLLTSPSWQTLSDVTGNGSTMSFTDPNTPQKRFYRIEVLP
jgi:hypothetical protein